MHKLSSFLLVPIAVAVPSIAHATLIPFFNDPAGWKAMASDFKAIDFTGFTHGTIISDQYSHLGLNFRRLSFINESAGYSDGWGLFSFDGMSIAFDTPLHAFATDHLGVLAYAFYLNGDLVATTGMFAYQGLGPKFSGIVSEQAFDEVHIFKPQPPFSNNIVSLDSVYWGAPIPAPGMLPLLAAALLTSRRPRREGRFRQCSEERAATRARSVNLLVRTAHDAVLQCRTCRGDDPFAH